MAQENIEPIKLLFLGVRLDFANKKLVSKWHVVDDIPNNGESLEINNNLIKIYSYPMGKGRNKFRPSVGQIWQFEANEAGSIYPNTRKIIGLWEHDGQRMEWGLESQAIEANYEAERKSVKIDLSPLEPVRAAYQNAVGKHRNLILAEIVRYITAYQGGKK